MIDFRSDTVTKPCNHMRDIMYNAPVGDDVYGDDESVNKLEAYARLRFNVEDALFCSSGTQTNLLALLLGSEQLIAKARRWRKVLGGGMRQAGMLAAAGQYALENNTQRLVDDHANARYLAQQLNEISGFDVNMNNTTNMVYATFNDSINITTLAANLKVQGILISSSKQLRLITHLGITQEDINAFVKALTAHI